MELVAVAIPATIQAAVVIALQAAVLVAELMVIARVV
jgi:hypothetical protein